jgi:aminoglycoside phosphotransferase (APT) family kinase protein
MTTSTRTGCAGVALRLAAEHAGVPRDADVASLGKGTDHAAFLVDGRLVVRLLNETEPASATRVARETGLLKAVADVAPVPVPRPVFAVATPGCIAHEWLGGESLLDVLHRGAHAEPVAARLGGLLQALHGAPREGFAPFAAVDDFSLEEMRAEAVDHRDAATGVLPPRYHRAIEAFLREPPPPGPAQLVFTHNDLGIEHVLVDPATGAVTGVIDWSDAAFADPASDFARILRDLGWAGLGDALDAYGPGASHIRDARARVLFRARCGLLEDLVHGLEHDDARYVVKSVAGVARLFGCP